MNFSRKIVVILVSILLALGVIVIHLYVVEDYNVASKRYRESGAAAHASLYKSRR